MASGSSGRPNSGSKGFDFASDDILCSYEDYVNQSNSDGNHSDPSLSANPTQDFQKSRISRSSVFPTTNAYSQPEESLNQELLSAVERTMKKYADNLMRFLEGISSRLSQLELYCYNLDKSIGEMRSDLVRDHGDADSKLKFLEKHLQEVHRSVQILRDKQELAETQKELAKLQFVQNESSPPAQEERAAVSAPEPKKSDDVSDTPNTQLALALPSQIPPPQPSHSSVQQQSSAAQPQPPSQAVGQLPPYYMPNPQNYPQQSYLPADPQYRVPQPAQSQVSQTAQSQQYPQYQQQWSQQVSQPMPPPPPQQPPMPPPPQQPPMQPGQQPHNQMRAPAPQSQVYPSYMTSQPSNPPPESMQVPFPGSQQSGVSRPEAMPYGYGGPGRPVQPQPLPQHMKGSYSAHQGDGYATGASHPPMSSGGTYMVYDTEGGRPLHAPQQTHYPQSGFPPASPSLPNMPPPSSSSLMIRNPSPQQYVRSHPYNELIDKLVSMGYRGDHVMSVIQRLEESGQPVDFNAVLDRLNGNSSGSSQRSW